MSTTPRIVERAEQPYAAIQTLCTMRTASDILPPLVGEVLGWLDARGVPPAGAPLFKYNVIDMERELEVEVGVPVATAVMGDGRVVGGVLPAGRYVIMTHIGHYDGLVEATGRLLRWGASQGLKWDMSETEAGQRWGARLEIYEIDPQEEPDPDRWATELAFRLAD